ncbi:MAG: acyl-CoA dehydrogenase [Sneathiella sp.]|jgi:citronellyl-CoA dehydrogenase|uniref:acyl-CoA dehydrogenase family protein n=1 Tax=Sneathiella sp. TaxID=1964365 RepID=UPI000C4E0AD7|nr:acyl-CoA dehydrogenase family protein [Sneathiella sp.]MAL78465.1 acyl-CoA dehydrogenase [Sneathiella sp.]|tara:strand:+ start:6739 stop:7884 length:1146 start_codon:yes stop_codon:yes gene_type:complete
MIFTQEHRELAESLKKFIEAEINPYVDEWEEAEQFPAHELFKKMGDMGFLGISKPEEYGGSGLDYSYEAVASEALGYIACGGVAMGIGVQTNMSTPALARFGSDELRRDYLAPAIAGDMVGCVGVTEAAAGSDVASLKTTARKDGDDYVINGSKMYITNALQADWICLLANTGDGPVHKNKSLIIVPMDSPGITKHKLRKIGMMSSDTGQLFFDDVRVPQRNRIGEEGLGFIYQMKQFQEERLFAASRGPRVMQEAINETIAYTRERKAFGKAILDNQVVNYRLAELQTEVEALRALTFHAVERYVAGEDVSLLASMAKLKVGRLQREVMDSCLQYWGGQGYMWESSISRKFRDFRLTSIGGGADEVMLKVITKMMGISPD